MTHFEVRKKFLQFFKRHHHTVLPSIGLTLDNDPSLLFVNAGMNQFKNVFLGLTPPVSKNIVTIQKCFRVGGKHNDLEEVGSTPLHHTFFEMMGNFSFGGYFKEQAIQMAWEFLTQELKIPKEHLWITVHQEDKKSYKTWNEQEKIPENKIYKLGDKDNFWQMGETGPCGYCSEIHYYKGKNKNPDPSQFMEIWNLVFMEFNLDKNGKKEKLPLPCVDTGLGVERLCSILQNKTNNYHSDLFSEIIQEIEKHCNFKYKTERTAHETNLTLSQDSKQKNSNETNLSHLQDSTKKNSSETNLSHLQDSTKKNSSETNLSHLQDSTKKNSSETGLSLSQNSKQQNSSETDLALLQADRQKAFHVIADHSRAISLLIADSVRPGNQKEGYVLRRIIRRSLYYSQKLLDQTEERGKNDQKLETLLLVGTKKAIQLMEQTAQDLGKHFVEYEKYFEFLASDKDSVIKSIVGESTSFSNSLKEGEKKLEEFLQEEKKKLKTSKNKEAHKKIRLSEQKLWDLYSTYGFPMDLTRLMAQERACDTPTEKDMKNYIDHLSKKPEPSSAKNNSTQNKEEILKDMYLSLKNKEQNHISKTDSATHTQWTAYKKDQESASILQITQTSQAKPSQREEKLTAPSQLNNKTSITQDSEGWIVLDKTCFYPEGGGPIGDKGWIETTTGKALIVDCQKYETMLAHKVKVVSGELKTQQELLLKVDKDFRKQIAISHSSTHLLNSALRSLLGDSIRQAGSLVEPGHLRFDFTFDRPLTKKELYQIEEKIQKNITQKEDVDSFYQSFPQAQKEGALYLKGENYGQDQVRVIRIGESSSRELCGGIHIKNTEEIEAFKIVSEKGVQAGVRRISAYTGALAKQWEELLIKENINLRKHLKLPLPKKDLQKDYKKFQTPSLLKTKANQEEENKLFINRLEKHEKELKTLKKNIIHWDNSKETSIKKEDSTSHSFDFPSLIQQMLMLAEWTSLSIMKEKETHKFWEDKIKSNLLLNTESNDNSFFEPLPDLLEKFKTKEQELKKWKAQWNKIKEKGLTKEKLLHQAIDFELKGLKGKLLVVSFPIEDRKTLSGLSDSLLSVLSSGILIVTGESEPKHPITISLTKDFQNILSAGTLLKKIVAPLCQGQGGGKVSFAQGSISNLSAFAKLKTTLVEKIKQDLL